MIAAGAVLLAGCTVDDATNVAPTATPIAISFNCTIDNNDENNMTRAANGHTGNMDSEDLYYTGFGIFASQAAGREPDLMYNQKVSFTFVGDLEAPLKGFWSYSPLKYWPSDLDGLYFCAYAPYVEKPAADDGTNTGIVGMSENTATTPYILYRRSLKPEDNVDLLWSYCSNITEKEPLMHTMRHALARIKVNIKVDALPANTKVLLKRITLSGTMTKTARLILNEDNVADGKHYPTWEALSPADTEDRTIIIDNDPDNEDSYGVIDPQVRYIEGLPYSWQPDGVKADDYSNALFTDRTAYIYLIPQDNLVLSCKVSYYKMTTSDPTPVLKVKTTEDLDPITITSLRGNATYNMNITLKNIES